MFDYDHSKNGSKIGCTPNQYRIYRGAGGVLHQVLKIFMCFGASQIFLSGKIIMYNDRIYQKNIFQGNLIIQFARQSLITQLWFAPNMTFPCDKQVVRNEKTINAKYKWACFGKLRQSEIQSDFNRQNLRRRKFLSLFEYLRGHDFLPVAQRVRRENTSARACRGHCYVFPLREQTTQYTEFI